MISVKLSASSGPMVALRGPWPLLSLYWSPLLLSMPPAGHPRVLFPRILQYEDFYQDWKGLTPPEGGG